MTWSILIIIFEICGLIAAFHAVMNVRTSQAAVAWALSLVMLPFIAVPLYLLIGRDKFRAYSDVLKDGNIACDQRLSREFCRKLNDYAVNGSPDSEESLTAVYGRITSMPITRGNRIEILKDASAAYPAIFNAVDSAENYVLVSYYSVNDDESGRELKQRLIARARRGIRVYFLYDEIGSAQLSSSYISEMQSEGIDVSPFWSYKRYLQRFQLNFRNHRKIVVVDGHTTFTGGLNIGDEHLGKNRKIGPWRDTHLKIEGPAALCAQMIFVRDWYWAAEEMIDLNWESVTENSEDVRVLILGTGPADTTTTCILSFLAAINAARKRLWIASPYFVPERSIAEALKLASLRGVDVRIILPLVADHRIVHLASFAYLSELCDAGVRFFRYRDAMLHHKILLKDDDLGAVGTVNMDQRSMYLNFEIMTWCFHQGFCRDLSAMLEDDLSRCTEIDADDYHRRNVVFRAAVHTSNLLAPIL